MNFYDIKILYVRELRSALRERSIVVNGLLIPILLYPVLIWLMYTGFTFVSGQNDDLKSRLVLLDIPAAHEQLRKQIVEDKFIELKVSADPMADVRSGAIDALVEFVPPKTGAGGDAEDFGVRITYDESRDQSTQAKTRITEKLSAYRDSYIQASAIKLGFTPERFQDFWVEQRNASTDRQMGQFVMGLLLPMMLIIMLAIGSFYPAVDSTAGERENSTWETIMTAATPRSNIIVAKYLYVTTMSFIAGVLNLCAMIFSMRAILAPLGGGGVSNMVFQIPVASIPVILLGAALLALFIAAVVMTLASFARTFKEGQSLVSPFYIVLILPIQFLQSPGQEFTTRLALVPIVNVVMMFREAMAGTYHWPLIATTLAVESICVFLALRLAMTVLQYEDVITGSYSGSFARFLKERVFRRKN